MKKQLSLSKKSWERTVTRSLTLMMLLLFGTMNKAAAKSLPPVKYMAYDTSTGEMVEKTCTGTYIPVTGTITLEEVYLLIPGWYVVSGNTTVNKGLSLTTGIAPAPIGARRNVTAVPNEEVNIILLDGATLTVAGGLLIDNGVDLNIYAQSGNTGIATFNSDEELSIPANGVMSVHGGVINASLSITCNGTFNVYSGQLNANFKDITGDSGVNGAVNLSWARGTDSYFSNFYGKAEDSGTVTLLKDMYYNDGTKYVKVAAGSVDKATIAGKTLVPGMELTLAAASSTWYNDSDYDWALPTGLTAYAVAFNDAGAVTTTKLTYIPAKTGVLLEGTASTSYFLTPYTGTTSTVTSLLTTGTPTAYKDYIYDGTDFVLCSESTALADGKCYLSGAAAKIVTGTTVDAVKIVTPTNGTIKSVTKSGTKVTLEVEPSEGYYITATDIVVTKTAPNGKALARGLAEKLTVTAVTVDATGKGTYTFTLPEGYGAMVEATFTAQTDISGATVTLEWTAKDYKPDTEQKAPVTKVTLNGTDLSDTDYGVTYKETAWINQGTYTINVTGKGKYKGTATTTFKINALKVAAVGSTDGGGIVRWKDSQKSASPFNGAPKLIEVVVGGIAINTGTTTGTTLNVTKDGAAVGGGCVEAGAYSVTVTGNVDGSAMLTIEPKTVTTVGTTATLEIELTDIPEGGYVYDGTAKTPGVKVYDLTVSPKAEIDSKEYTVGYAVNTNAGTATVTIKDVDGGNYTVSGSTKFTIAPLTVTDFTLTGIPEGGFVYDGTPKTVGVAYNNGTENITISDSEYNMTYKLGTADATELKAAGTYTVTLTDKTDGNYTISGSKELTIAPKVVSTTATGGAAGTLTITLTPTEATYTGEDLTPTVTVKDGETTINASEYTVAFTLNGAAVEKCINAGTYTVTLTDKEGGNYTVSGSTTFTINPKPVSTTATGGAAATLTITLNPTEATYTGKDLTPTVTVKDGDTPIDKSEYTVAFTLNGTAVDKCINIGTYTVTLTDVDGGNYTVSGTATFTINPPSYKDEKTGVVYQYEDLADGTVKIIGVIVPDGVTDVDIPARIGDKEVSAIGKDAFKGNTGVVNITIPTTANPLNIDVSAFTTGEGGDKEPDVIVPNGMVEAYAKLLLPTIGSRLASLLTFKEDHKYRTVSSGNTILIPVEGLKVLKAVLTDPNSGVSGKVTTIALQLLQNLSTVNIKGVNYYKVEPKLYAPVATARAAIRVETMYACAFMLARAGVASIAVRQEIKCRYDMAPARANSGARSRKAVNEADPDADNLLYPVLEPTHFAAGKIWILKDDALYGILDNDDEAPAGVAVVMLPDGTSGARIISIEEDNSEATGISDATRLNDKGEMINDHWYTLDGRKLDVAPKTKGVYIHNGVKVVVK